jgi:sugar phosphate isomerase/epimerase
MPMPFPFGVNQFTTESWTFEEDVARYAEAGVDAIEIGEIKLDDARLPEQFALIRERGLAIGAIQPRVRTFFDSQIEPEPHAMKDRVDCLKATIRRLAPFAPGTTFVTNTGAAPDGNLRLVTQMVVRKLRELAPFAAEQGVRLALEPLSPTSMNRETAIWTVAQALDILDAVDRPEIGLCLDLWNSWHDADLEDEIARAGKRIFVLHVSDWRAPRASSDRRIPGTGVIPFGPLLQAVHRAGYRGPCTLEIFSKNVPDPVDPWEAIRESRKGLDLAWDAK